MAILTYLRSDYIIKGTLSIAENALGRQDLVSVTIGSNTRITVDPELVGFAGDNNAKSWKVTGKNFQLQKPDIYHIYLKCQRNTNDSALFLSTFLYDMEGYIVDGEGNRIDGESGDVANWYIRIGYITAPVADKRTAYLDMGKYGTDSGNQESVSNIVANAVSSAIETIKGMFLRKDKDDETKFGLTMKSLVVAEDAEIKGELKAKNVKATNSVTAATATVSGQTKTNTLAVDDTAVVKTSVQSPDHKTDKYKTGANIGHGARVWEDAQGDGHVETDELIVRKAAYFRTLNIEEVKHIGGENVLSAASCTIARVQAKNQSGTVIYDSGVANSVKPEGEAKNDVAWYRCLFEKEANGRTVYNEWKVGDQALCRESNLSEGFSENVSTRYYWRLVIGIGTLSITEGGVTRNYYRVDLSNNKSNVDRSGCYSGPGCDVLYSADDVPQPNDSLVLMGSRIKAEPYRSCAMVMSTADSNSPSRTYLWGIHSFNLSEAKPVERMEWVPAVGDVAAHAHWQVGDEQSYIDFDGNTGLSMKVKSLHIAGTGKDVASVVNAAGKITEDGYISSGQLPELRKMYLDLGAEHAELNSRAAYIIEAVPRVYDDEEENTKYYEDLTAANAAYQAAYGVVMEDLLQIANSEENPIPQPNDFANHLLVLDLCRVELFGLLNVMDTFYMRQTDEATKIGNRFFMKDDEGEWTVRKNGLLLTKDFSRLFSQQTIGTTGKKLEAYVQTSVADGVSSAKIKAEQIDLRGETTVTGVLKRGLLTVVDNDVIIGPADLHKVHVDDVCSIHLHEPHTSDANPYIATLEIELDKLSQYTYLTAINCSQEVPEDYTLYGNGVPVIVCPNADNHANETWAWGEAGMTENMRDMIDEYYGHWCAVRNRQQEDDWWRDEDYGDWWKKYISYQVSNARKWIGTDMIIFNNTGGAIELFGVSVKGTEYDTLYDGLDSFLVDNNSMIRLHCVHEYDPSTESGGFDRIVWYVEKVYMLSGRDDPIRKGIETFDPEAVP